jgi:hypothetical protein
MIVGGICFAAFAVYKELERRLNEKNCSFSVEKAINHLRQVQQLTVTQTQTNQITYYISKSRTKILTQFIPKFITGVALHKTGGIYFPYPLLTLIIFFKFHSLHDLIV